MVKLYFLGGENTVRRDAKEINASAFQEAGGTPRVLILSWARPSFDSSYTRRRRLENYFRCLGASEISWANISDDFSELEKIASGFDIIYLTGGQVSVLLNRLRVTGADELLHIFKGVIIGRSAGALVLGRKCFVMNKYNRRQKIVNGLGMVNFSVKVHYRYFQDEFLKKASKKGKIYAIPQQCALISDGESLTAIGEIQLFENGEKIRFEKSI